MVKHYPGLVLSDDAGEIVFGELYRLREADALLREFDMYEACGEGFPEPTQYLRRMLPVTLAGRHGERGVDLYLQLAGGEACPHRSGRFLRDTVSRIRVSASQPDAQRLVSTPRMTDSLRMTETAG